MVGLTAATAAVVLTAGAGAPAVAGVGAGIVQGAVSGTAATGAAVAGSAGAGMAAGAVTGAAVGGTATATGVGAAVGATGAAAVTSSSAGAAGLTAGIAAGPVGWLVLGADEDEMGITYDCWKPIVHDECEVPSEEKLFKEIVQDPRVKELRVVGGTEEFPQIILENIWGENFEIKYVALKTGLALHAVSIPSEM